MAVVGIVHLVHPERFSSSETEGERKQILRDLAVLHRAVVRFAKREGNWPESLTALVPRDVAELPRDPYGRDYVIVRGGKDLLYVFCRGSDGQLKRYPPDMATSVTLSEVQQQETVHE